MTTDTPPEAQTSKGVARPALPGAAESGAVGDMAAFLASLSPEQRAELAKLLTPPPNTS